jgi:hypothetical protein
MNVPSGVFRVSRKQREEKEYLEEKNPRREARLGAVNNQTEDNAPSQGSKPRSRGRLSWQLVSAGEWGASERQGGRLLPMRKGGRAKGERPEREVPGRGSGMEQARKPVSGVIRREAAKAWGRNVARSWETSWLVDARG